MRKFNEVLYLCSMSIWVAGIILIVLISRVMLPTFFVVLAWSAIVFVIHFLIKKFASKDSEKSKKNPNKTTLVVLKKGVNAVNMHMVATYFLATVHVCIGFVFIEIPRLLRKYWDLSLIYVGIFIWIYLRFHSDIPNNDLIMIIDTSAVFMMTIIATIRVRCNTAR